ncbi:MAG: hypothetical protein LBG95_05060 [Treponema sp.]|jgi:nucleoid-associated protein YgaU|nr:hypothetical protein [Treponema sp.]
MSRRFYLVLLVAAIIGVQPVFAEDAEKPTVDLEEVSDEDLFTALDSASEIELINKNELIRNKALGETPENAETTVQTEKPSTDTQGAVVTKEAPDGTEQKNVPSDILNNKYFLESQRLAKLAEDAYSFGDYDASAAFAEESILNAQNSDEYVARRLKGESEAVIVAALDSSDLPMETPQLPATYTVRSWGSAKDCFWNIAGRPWVYGNPRQWRVLYEANKSKLPEPNNPNLIEPGIVLDIPSIKGEVRQGAWDADKTYEAIQ